jgi:MFS family permease
VRLPAAIRPPRPLERREIGLLALFGVIGITQGWAGAAITHTLPFVQENFDLSDARVFDLMATVRAAALIALGLSWWSDRAGRRRPLLVAFALLTLGNLATALVPGLAAYTVLQSVARIGTIAIASLAVVVLAEEIGGEVRGYAIAVYTLLGSMGTGVGLALRPLTGSADDGWRILFLLSAVPLIALPLLARRLGESRIFRRPHRRPPLAAVLRRGYARRFWPMATLSFALSAFSSPAANLALVRLENELAWSTGAASLLLIATSAPGVTFGLLIGGRLADIVGRRPTEAGAILVGVGGGVLFYFAEGLPMGVGIFLSTFGASAFAPAFASHRAEIFPTEIRSTASAWLVNASILGGLAGFAAGRFVVDAWGLAVTMAGLGAFLLCAATSILFLPETRGVRLTPPGEGPADPTAATPG